MGLRIALVCDACGATSPDVVTDPNDVAIRGTLAATVRGWKRQRLGRDTGMVDLCPGCAGKRLASPVDPRYRPLRSKSAFGRDLIPFDGS
jgi:hypothetical protein